MQLRRYRKTDALLLYQLFYHTVHTVNRQDYTPAQVQAWADGKVDLAAWNQSLLEHTTWVALKGNRIVGFEDISSSGYLDRLFVHQDFQRQGIASALCRRLEATPGLNKITVHASLTAQPFFEKRHYQIIEHCYAQRQGILLSYARMEKSLLLSPL